VVTISFNDHDGIEARIAGFVALPAELEQLAGAELALAQESAEFYCRSEVDRCR
jgi:hypothetical protein